MLAKTATGTDNWASVTLSTIIAVTNNDYIYPTIYFNNANDNNGIKGGAYANSVTMIVEVID